VNGARTLAHFFSDICSTERVPAMMLRLLACDDRAGNYLIQFDKMEESEAPPLPPMELYTLEEPESRTCEDCGQKLVSLFKTRADMTQWIAWLNEPEKPAGQSGKVVHLKKPH
jgi:hypothetical protein